MNETATTHIGPLGSTVHVLRADAGTIAELAAIDWSRHFRRVCLDPVRGVITLMSPSFPHEDLSKILDDIIDAAGSLISGATKGLRSTRLRRPDEPPGTGMEPDCAFYVGDRARRYFAALGEGDEAEAAFVERTAPDLVVEVEITGADEGKAARYAAMGVREMWRLHGRKGTKELRVEFLALDAAPDKGTAQEAPEAPDVAPDAGSAPRLVEASQVLRGLTPDDVCAAVTGVRAGRNHDERKDAVARIVRRRRHASARVREEKAAYATS